ncbi:MAG: TlpA disulfide reductase family protein [Gammaproteobacteria bacterium]|nr:TlpA disulfide reductase family protein [Gammaproteobacteria bacterium]
MRNIIILSLLLTLFLPTAFASTDNKNVLNKKAPAFALADIHHKRRSLSEWKNRVVILNFWATWCVPCRKEIPLLNSLQKNHSSKELQIVGIAIDHWAAVKKYVSEIPIDYVNLIGNIDATLLVKRYGNDRGVLPYTVVISPDGKIVSIAAGQLTEDYLNHITEKYL